MTEVATRIEVKRLHPLFVAEIIGVDLTAPLSRDEFRGIWEAFNEHQILVFPDQPLDDESQIAFSRNFGDLETMVAHAANNFRPTHISTMTNLDAKGDLLPLDDPAMVHRLRNEEWHTDSSFKPVASLCSLLHARIVPPVGGNTDFASARAAYETVPADRKRVLEKLEVIHRMAKPEDEEEDKGYSAELKQQYTVVHPLVRTNPVNRRKNLYVGAHAQEVVGMPRAEGRALLKELNDLCTQPQFVYSHAWRQHDLVIWDNRCALHRATPFDRTRYKRKLHRTTVAGMTPDTALATMPGRAA